MDLSLELYRVFYTVAKHSSFSRAADELFVTQSAVSQSIKTIEEKLGYPLFVRTTKSVALTLDGKVLYDNIKDAFVMLYEGIGKIRNYDDPSSGEINIASTDTLCKYFLLDKIKLLYKQYPKLKIKIINRTSLECLKMLQASEIDFALINIPDNIDSTKFKIEKKYTFTDNFIAAKDSAYPDTMQLKAIAAQTILTLDEKSVTRKFLDSLFAQKGLKIEPEIELQSVDILIEMSKIGMGISFVPDICLTKEVRKHIKVIKIKEQLPKREFGVISKKGSRTMAVSESLFKFL